MQQITSTQPTSSTRASAGSAVSVASSSIRQSESRGPAWFDKNPQEFDVRRTRAQCLEFHRLFEMTMLERSSAPDPINFIRPVHLPDQPSEGELEQSNHREIRAPAMRVSINVPHSNDVQAQQPTVDSPSACAHAR
jgi:hypothetical protein